MEAEGQEEEEVTVLTKFLMSWGNSWSFVED